jgi:hypothetical protein
MFTGFYPLESAKSHFFHSVLIDLQRCNEFLRNAKNLRGSTLLEAVGNFSNHRLLTEFSLGKRGFGEPDGVIFTGVDENNPCCIFVEGKVEAVNKQAKRKRSTLQSASTRPVSNSKLDKQLELRWRFLNALEASADKKRISEQYLPLPRCFTESDRAYLKKSFCGDQSDYKQWRRLKKRAILDDVFRACGRRFYLLAITKDHEYPASRMEGVRLFDSRMEQIKEPREHIFWLPLKYLESKVQRLPEKTCSVVN